MMVWLWATLAAAAPLTADDAVTQVLSRAPRIAEAEAELEASRGRVRGAGPPDPTVSGAWAAVGEAWTVELSQPLSLTGEGLAARRQALAQVRAAEARLERARLETAAEVRQVWIAAVEAHQRAVLAAEAAEVAQSLRLAAEQRLQTGDGSLLDARLARLEAAQAVAGWLTALTEEASALAGLAAQLGVSLDHIELPGDPLAGAPAPAERPAHRSDLESARHDAEAAEAGVRQARAGVLPPVSLGGFYEEEDGATRFGPAVELTVPLWRRNAQARAEARAAQHVALARLQNLEQVVISELQAAESLLSSMEQTAARLDVDVPTEARETLAAVSLGYQAGEFDLLAASQLRRAVLDAQQAWLQARRLQAEARVALLLARGDPALLGPSAR